MERERIMGGSGQDNDLTAAGDIIATYVRMAERARELNWDMEYLEVSKLVGLSAQKYKLKGPAGEDSEQFFIMNYIQVIVDVADHPENKGYMFLHCAQGMIVATEMTTWPESELVDESDL